MNFFEKLIYLLQGKMNTPTSFGWFHFMWIALIIFFLILLCSVRKKYSENQLKVVLGIYSIIALVLEILKQLIWSFNYDSVTNVITWDYQWYAFPFQLCTTPLFVGLICLFLKDSKFRNSLLSYLSYITILGSVVTIIMPDSCFVSNILVNVHTMWLHFGSFVVSVYLIMTGEVKLTRQNLKRAFIVFLVFVGIAELLNIALYNVGILNGETFNMFYISPYFVSTLPVFDIIWESVPYIVYLLTYILVILIGSVIIYYVAMLIKYIFCNYVARLNKRQVR